MHYLRQFFEALLYPLRALLTSPGSVSTGARKLAAISLPARISLLTFFLLIVGTIVAYFAFSTRRESATDWLGSFKWLLPLLIIAIPLVLYYVLRLWLEGELSRYPDIDYAWKAGMAELKTHGMDLQYTPLFLVLGSSGDLLEQSLFSATQLPLRVREVPTGAAALHWYAEPDGIYLVCSQVGCLSKLAEIAKRTSESQRAQAGRTIPGTRQAVDPRGTMTEGQLDAQDPPSDVAPSDAKRSIVASQLFPSKAAVPSTRDIKGTISFAQDEDSVVAQAEQKHVSLAPEDQREQELRLEYVCRLIGKAREPLAPVNGVLTLVPYASVERGGREGTTLQQAIHRDVDTLVRTLKLRCPVVSLVVGMEEESGFRELVRRLPREVTAKQRFGKGFSVGNPPIPEQLEAVATHACGLFEAKVYELFREKGALAKPGNRKLYALLCKIRRRVRTPLTNVVVYGYADDPDVKKNAESEPLFYSGCYFAATGEADDRRAFVKGVFDKLPDEQEDLQWTEAALAEDERFRRWSQTTVLVDGLLLVSLVVMVIIAALK